MKRVDLLILDDEPSVCRALSRLFAARTDLAVETSESPVAALERIATAPPKVLLTDFRMPVMDGVQVLREARKLAPDTVRILMTGMAQREEVIAAINTGKIFRFVEKPWDDDAIVELVAEAIEQHDHLLSGRLVHEEHADLRRAVDAAGTIQRSLLPDAQPRLYRAEAACVFAPCEYASGDYVDLLPVDNGRTVMLLGDVAGHGIGAALFVATARALLRSGLSEGEPLGAVVGRTNRFLCNDMRNGRFLTLFAAIHDPDRSELEFVNAGQTPPLLHSGGRVTLLRRTAIPLGVLPDASFERTSRIRLGPGDTLLASTDGVSEARDAAGEFFGMDRIEDLLVRNADLPPEALVERLREQTLAFSADAGEDDLTLLAYRAMPVPVLVRADA